MPRLPAVPALLLALLALLLAAPAAAQADVVWLCKPGMPNDPCVLPMDTTVREVGKPERVETPASKDTGVDCFYVYPTVSNQRTPNADKSRDPELVSIAKYQAARFSRHCRVFAPIYRQSTLASIGTGYASASGADRELAYRDVLEAWRAYLEEDNDGRGVVLVGHSQGASMLRLLLRREIEATLQKRKLVSALLIGSTFTTKKGELVGGDARETPLCTEEAQVRCVVAYSTFQEDPPANSRFGRPSAPDLDAACTDPRPLIGAQGAVMRALQPSEAYAPGPIAAGIAITYGGTPPTAPTTWVVPPDRFQGACRKFGDIHVLRYDPLPGSRRPVFFPEPTWGTHLVDVNLLYEPLVELVRRQAERWVEPQVALTRRCSGGRLRVAVTGRDASFVRDVNFKRGKRLVVRDTEAPFTASVPARGPLRAVAHLAAGAPLRVVLSRSVPRC
jgi:pimeloyl-ACP methyl ester carboxylesterase